jgi:hypothetical protein
MGMAMAKRPALLTALADRAKAGGIEELKVYYFEETRIAGETILRYRLNGRICPYCMFVTTTERALIKHDAEDGGRKVTNDAPSSFRQAHRLLIDESGIAFVCTVSPVDRRGCFSFGAGNDYLTKAARSAKRLMVEGNVNMPRVNGAGAELHVSEVGPLPKPKASTIWLQRGSSGPARLLASWSPMEAGSSPLTCSERCARTIRRRYAASLLRRRRQDIGSHGEDLWTHCRPVSARHLPLLAQRSLSTSARHLEKPPTSPRQ